MNSAFDPLKPLWRTAVALIVVFLLDAGLVGQGAISMMVAFSGVALLLGGAALAASRGQTAVALVRIRRGALYLTLGLATFGALRIHAFTSRTRAEQLIRACEAFQKTHGKLPDALTDLVPEFVPAVPRAKYTAMYGEFTYWISNDDAHTLMFVAVPPFGRRLYHFEQHGWSTLD